MEDIKVLNTLLQKYRIGVVLISTWMLDTGILSACEYEHIHIADSLLMADRAVQMAEAGVQSSNCCFGVDFMSENVRAVVDAAGYSHIPVYRVDHRK